MPLSRETRRRLAALRRSAEADTDDEAGEAPALSVTALPASADASTGTRQPGREGLLPGHLRERLRARLAAPRQRGQGAVTQPAPEGARPTSPVALVGPPVDLENLLPGEVLTAPSGVCYVMRPHVATVSEWGEAVAETLVGQAPEALGLAHSDPIAFLDIETTGLSALPVFLVGILHLREGEVSLTQILARDYPEEAGLLHQSVEALRGCRTLFTYNGASFDLPYLSDRAVYHAVEFSLEAEHTDLLPLARRRFRGAVPDCRLQTLERHVCGRDRGDDIPASEIPQRYRDFVRSGDARLLESVIRHNRLDLLTLAELLPHCLADGPG